LSNSITAMLVPGLGAKQVHRAFSQLAPGSIVDCSCLVIRACILLAVFESSCDTGSASHGLSRFSSTACSVVLVWISKQKCLSRRRKFGPLGCTLEKGHISREGRCEETGEGTAAVRAACCAPSTQGETGVRNSQRLGSLRKSASLTRLQEFCKKSAGLRQFQVGNFDRTIVTSACGRAVLFAESK
jgi:hypothetical protein